VVGIVKEMRWITVSAPRLITMTLAAVVPLLPLLVVSVPQISFERWAA
jgi:hypothetical protein